MLCVALQQVQVIRVQASHKCSPLRILKHAAVGVEACECQVDCCGVIPAAAGAAEGGVEGKVGACGSNVDRNGTLFSQAPNWIGLAARGSGLACRKKPCRRLHGLADWHMWASAPAAGGACLLLTVAGG
jgi:hypothetical protein